MLPAGMSRVACRRQGQTFHELCVRFCNPLARLESMEDVCHLLHVSRVLADVCPALRHNPDCHPVWRLEGHGRSLPQLFGCGSKLNRRGYAGFGPCFHLPGFHFGTGFLSHSHFTILLPRTPWWFFRQTTALGNPGYWHLLLSGAILLQVVSQVWHPSPRVWQVQRGCVPSVRHVAWSI